MFRSSQTLYVAIPASATAGAAPARDGSPRRDSLGPRSTWLVVSLAACVFFAFVGWVLARGDSDLEASSAATGAAASACYTSDCIAALAPVSRPLPREWRFERKNVEYQHMYRE